MQTRTCFMAVVVILLVGTSSVFAQEVTDCMSCHNDTTVITDKQIAASESAHGTGGSYVRGTSSGCAGCHSGGAFSKMVAAGLRPDQVEEGDVNPTRQDCRACHQVHVEYTTADWALETTAAVTLYAFGDEGVTYDGGKGNLCANCHQPRRVIDGYVDEEAGTTNVSSSHWGPHHGPQSAMLLGVGGAGDVAGEPMLHGRFGDTCVACHVGENNGHTFEAVLSSCALCHDEDLDLDAFQEGIADLIEQLRDLLLAKGSLAAEEEYEINEDGVIEAVVVGYEPVRGDYPIAEAAALWNYILIDIEDGSLGVHNPAYTRDLLEASIAALQ